MAAGIAPAASTLPTAGIGRQDRQHSVGEQGTAVTRAVMVATVHRLSGETSTCNYVCVYTDWDRMQNERAGQVSYTVTSGETR